MPFVVVGIIPIGGALREEYPLVASRVHYNITDVYTVASVVQEYHSNATVNRDVEYVFPLPPSAAVCSFKAVIDDTRVVKGIVKEKNEAKKEYQKAVSQGYTAGLLQQEHADVFRVSLGNLRPQQKISVHISFVSIIPHDGSSPQMLRITMPTAIAPRYGSPPTNIPWFRKNPGNRFDLTVAIQMNKAVTSISSPSHPIGLTLGCAQKELQGDFEPSKAFVYLSDSAFLDKDIVVLISAQGLDTPRCTVERWLASEGAEETTDAYALTLVPKFELPALPRQEYIFLVDRSGSMGTGRMNSVKASLQIMLKSLPSRNTTFNIVSFGSRYTSLWSTPRAYTAESVEEASRHVDGFTSNYGGTQLRSAIEYAFNSRAAARKTKEGEQTPASVFILTDGEAWDLGGVLDTVTNGVEKAKKEGSLLRAFVLGVGNQVSTAMCEGIARSGKGTAVFVAEGEKPDAKLMGLLKAARGAVIEDLSVDWGVGTEEKAEQEDEFELINEPPQKSSPPPAPPISLFDENAAPEATDLGPTKTIVHLSPPPRIQQAPKSDKLPIPLYPGFRCSIFAIIKQSSNPGPPASHINITGKVLGRDVVLQVPVAPVVINSEATKDVVENEKLLHTLAAKALIQIWEDMPTTPETKAQIERLGKRYSLASSVTSFLAIDKETDQEIQSSPAPQAIAADSDLNEDYSPRRSKRKGGGLGYGDSTKSSYTSHYDPTITAALSSPVVDSSSAVTGYGSNAFASSFSSLSSTTTGFSSLSVGAGGPPPPPPCGAPPPPSYASQGYIPSARPAPGTAEKTKEAMQKTIDLVAERGDSFDLLGEQSSYTDSFAEGSASSHKSKTASAPKGSSFFGRFKAAKKAPAAPSVQAPSLPPREAAANLASSGSFGTAKSVSASPMLSDSLAPSGSFGTAKSVSASAATLASAKLSGRFGTAKSVSASPETLASAKLSGSLGTAKSVSASAAVSGAPLSLESIARAQNFDGSFPSDGAHLQSVQGGRPTAPPPGALAGLTGDGGVKATVWATVLTLGVLEKKFAGEKEAWEMLAEKAKEFVEGALQDMGVDAGEVEKMIADLLAVAVAAI